MAEENRSEENAKDSEQKKDDYGGDEIEEAKAQSKNKRFWRSASWCSHSAPSSPRLHTSRSYLQPYTDEKSASEGIPFPVTPRSQSNRNRPLLPPLQPVPRSGIDDPREWSPSTPRSINRMKNGLEIKLDLAVVQRSRNASEPTEMQMKRDKFAFFDKECSRVAEHIYLGSDAVARNIETLKSNGITHVLNCVGFICPEYFKEDFKYKTLWLQDSPSEDITSILYDVFDYFEEVKEMNGRVFVHCCQGVSRSTSLVIAYLMWREGRSFEDAFQDVKAARGVTNPNMGFACQLLQAQKRVHASPVSPNSVVRMYRMAPHSPYDPLHLVPKTINNPGFASLDSRGAYVVHVPNAIYVWIGKICEPGIARAAKAAAGQFVHYERAQGPILCIVEGEESPEFWDVFNKCSGSRQTQWQGGNVKTEKKELPQGSESSTLEQGSEKNMVHKDIWLLSSVKSKIKQVSAYDADFELYSRALEGGVVPPSGAVTRVPARDSGWTWLRRKVLSGSIKESAKVQMAEEMLSGGSRDIDIIDFPCARLSCDSMTDNTEQVSCSPPSSISNWPSPDQFSGSDTPSPCSSPSLSPSLSDSPTISSLRTNTLLSSSLHKHMAAKNCPPTLAMRKSSVSPLYLPALSDCPSSSSPSPEYFAEVQRSNGNRDSTDLSSTLPEPSIPTRKLQGLSSIGQAYSNSLSQMSSKFVDVMVSAARLLTNNISAKEPEGRKKKLPRMYKWPRMEEILMFDMDDLDSRSAFIFINPCSTDETMKNFEACTYLWLGKDVESYVSLDTSRNRADLCDSQDGDAWEHSVERAESQECITVKVVKEGLEPVEFWSLFVNH